MKKIKLLILLLFLNLGLFAQDKQLMSKNGINILPKKGEVAIGIDAIPFLNLLNNKGNIVQFDFVSDNTFFFKYFTSDKKAIRTYFRLSNNSVKIKNDKNSEIIINLGFGKEKRYGKSRVQGLLGWEVGLSSIVNKVNIDTISTQISEFGIGGMIFTGVEYFVAPKLSIGGQFGYGIEFSSINDKKNRIEEKIFSLDMNNLGGSLILLFHF